MNAFQTFLEESGIPYVPNEPLSKHTTFQIGGACPFLVSPRSRAELAALLAALEKQAQEWMVLGNGSNLLVSDAGTQTVMFRLDGDFRQIDVQGARILAGGGASLSAVCSKAQQAGLSGLEFAYGIPGSVGGAVYMNAGAYGGEVGDVLLWAQVMDSRGAIRELTKEDLSLSYRHSSLQGRNEVLLRACFQLAPGDTDEIRRKMDDFMNRRRAKQPLEYPSAGSTFKRPEGAYAAALIEQCGLKGQRVGGAMVSEKHSGFLINAQNATCRDVEELIRLVQKSVQLETGYRLECEVQKVD